MESVYFGHSHVHIVYKMGTSIDLCKRNDSRYCENIGVYLNLIESKYNELYLSSRSLSRSVSFFLSEHNIPFELLIKEKTMKTAYKVVLNENFVW